MSNAEYDAWYDWHLRYKRKRLDAGTQLLLIMSATMFVFLTLVLVSFRGAL